MDTNCRIVPWNRKKFGQTIERAAMTLRRCARGLLAGAVTVMAVAGGSGIAQAEPDNTEPPPLPHWGQIPTTFPNPNNQSQPLEDWGGVGMACQNLLIGCLVNGGRSGS